MRQNRRCRRRRRHWLLQRVPPRLRRLASRKMPLGSRADDRVNNQWQGFASEFFFLFLFGVQ